MKNIIIVGGGPSGLTAGIYAKEKGYNVTILEKNDSPLKKLLITGNGRCNYFNSDQNLNHYHSTNEELINKLIDNVTLNEVNNYFNKLGIIPNIKDGYYYPYSNQSISVKESILNLCNSLNIKIITNYEVKEIKKVNNKFIINNDLICDKLILSTGGKSYPKTGSDGSSYVLAKTFGHSINKTLPSLVKLNTDGNYLNIWDGVRCDVIASLYETDKLIRKEKGIIQLTNYGISGICVFNLSGLASKNLKLGKKVEVEINFLPFLNVSFYEWFSERNQRIPNHSVEDLLESIFPYKLLLVLLKKAGINRNDYWSRLSEDKKEKLSSFVSNFPLEITDVESFDRAQVATGGVPLNEINPNTMESLLCSGCYLTGELLDVDGKCGGFNIAFAFMSGYLAGRSVVDAKN